MNNQSFMPMDFFQPQMQQQQAITFLTAQQIQQLNYLWQQMMSVLAQNQIGNQMGNQMGVSQNQMAFNFQQPIMQQKSVFPVQQQQPVIETKIEQQQKIQVAESTEASSENDLNKFNFMEMMKQGLQSMSTKQIKKNPPLDVEKKNTPKSSTLSIKPVKKVRRKSLIAPVAQTPQIEHPPLSQPLPSPQPKQKKKKCVVTPVVPENEPKVKQQKNPFIFFMQAQHLELKNSTEKIDRNQRMMMVSQKWKSMTDSEKEPYFRLAQEDRERYHREKLEQGRKSEMVKQLPQVVPELKKSPVNKKKAVEPKQSKIQNYQEKALEPFYFYMKIRNSELQKQLALIKENEEQGKPVTMEKSMYDKFPRSQSEIEQQIRTEWDYLNADQKSRFNMTAEIQKQLKEQGKEEDIETLRFLVLNQQMPQNFGQKSN